MMDNTTHHAPPATHDSADQPPTGRYVWDLTTDTWWWSDELYAMHGFAPGEVVPSTDLLLSHKHPEDLEKVARVIDEAVERGSRFSCYHRIVDSQQKVRHVLVVGGTTTRDGTTVELNGFFVDLTRTRRQDLQPSIAEALEGALEHRGSIDMAKGALMLGYGLDDDQAFDLLRSTSTSSNVKVQELARRLVHELASSEPAAGEPGRIDTLMARVTDPEYAGEAPGDGLAALAGTPA